MESVTAIDGGGRATHIFVCKKESLISKGCSYKMSHHSPLGPRVGVAPAGCQEGK